MKINEKKQVEKICPMEEKRTLLEDWRILVRAFKLWNQICPQIMLYNILCSIATMAAPYFTLYMSAQLVNELSGQCRPESLLMLAGITVFGFFAICIARRILKGRSNIWMAMAYTRMDLFLCTQENKMQYEHLENPEVTLLREEINASAQANGFGLWWVLRSIPKFMERIVDLIVSVSLTVSLFRVATDVDVHGFLAFINSPACPIAFIAILALSTVLSAKISSARTANTLKAWAPLAKNNMRLSEYSSIWGEDIILFNLKKVILKEMEKTTIHPPFFRNVERVNIKYSCPSTLLDTFLGMVVILIAAAKTFMGALQLGSFILYKGTVSRFARAITGLSDSIAGFRENNTYLLKLYRFLDLPDNMYHGTLAVEKRDDIDYEIEFRDVSFRYPNTDIWVLRHVSMKFHIGDKLAIVGENGSGKTTFIKLLCRLYDPTEGMILLNGIDITKYRYEEYLSLFSVVFQDYTLFQFSLAANVTASFDYDADKVAGCLEDAEFGDRLHNLERGVESVIGRNYEDDGIDLSRGELQKVALARALYKDAPFVILDEPTAALDPMAEAAVYEGFQVLTKHKTAVFISHRLSSCRFCDDIAVFHKGELVQRGSHDTLCAQEGKYRELWQAQAQYYQEKVE